MQEAKTLEAQVQEEEQFVLDLEAGDHLIMDCPSRAQRTAAPVAGGTSLRTGENEKLL